jgi:hypothetical protein
MLTKINILVIIKDHISTLVNFDTKKISIADFSLFFIFPLLISIMLTYFNIRLNIDIIVILVTSLSIFAGFLFNLLLLILDMGRKQEGSQILRFRASLLKQVFKNISFNILVSISAVIVLVLLSLLLGHYPDSTANNINLFNILIIQAKYLLQTLSFIAYYLLFLFLLTLLMILKRIYVLAGKEIGS